VPGFVLGWLSVRLMVRLGLGGIGLGLGVGLRAGLIIEFATARDGVMIDDLNYQFWGLNSDRRSETINLITFRVKV